MLKNKAIIMAKLGISYAGELCNSGLVNNGIIIKQSEKSNIKIFIPLDEIDKIILADGTSIDEGQLLNVYNYLNEINIRYNLNDEQGEDIYE